MMLNIFTEMLVKNSSDTASEFFHVIWKAIKTGNKGICLNLCMKGNELTGEG